MCTILSLGFKKKSTMGADNLNYQMLSHDFIRFLSLQVFRQCIVWPIYMTYTVIELWWFFFLIRQRSHFWHDRVVKFIKLVQFDWKWSQNVCLVNIDSCLMSDVSFLTFVTIKIQLAPYYCIDIDLLISVTIPAKHLTLV